MSTSQAPSAVPVSAPDALKLDAFFSDSLRRYYDHAPVVLASRTSFSPSQLCLIRDSLYSGSFNPLHCPSLRQASPGIPYVKAISLDDGRTASMLKVKLVDLRNFPEYHKLAAHVRGYDDQTDKPQAGFNKYRNQLTANRDGHGSYTMGLAAVNNTYIAPKAYLATDKAFQSGLVEWNQEFLALTGELGSKVMAKTFSKSYIEMFDERKLVLNTPCFGRHDRTQSFFNTAQINCSTASLQVGGTAGSVHNDASDCAASYSLVINCSVVRESTDLGWFWFPNLDLVVPVQAGYGIIFQGVEEHTGTPMRLDPTDRSPIPCEYAQETRFNIIAYPKRAMMDGTMKMNFDGEVLSGSSDCTMWRDGDACFGTEQAYQAWRQRTLAQLINDTCNQVYGLKEVDLRLLRPKLLKAISWDDKCSDDILGSDQSFSSIARRQKKALAQLLKIRELVKASISLPFHQMERRQEDEELAPEGVAGEAYVPSLDGDESRESSHDVAEHPQAKRPRVRERSPSARPLLLQTLQNPTGEAAATSHPSRQNTPAPPHSSHTSPASSHHSPPRLSAASPAQSSVISLPRPVSPPQRFGLFEKLFQYVDIESLNSKTADLHRCPIQEQGLNKGFKLLEQLPKMESIITMSAVDRIRTCQSYSQAFSLFQRKAHTAQVLSQAFRANFLTLLMEFIEVMDNRSLNIWLDANTVLPHASLALRLQKAIDHQFKTWEDEHARGVWPFSPLVVNAQDVLGTNYDESVNVNVRLNPREERRTPPDASVESKGIILEEIIYGLCFHRPVSRFLTSLGSRQRPVVEYVNRLRGGKNRSKELMISRIKFLRALQQVICPADDHLTFWGFIMITEMLQFLFLSNPGDTLNDDDIGQVLSLLSLPSHTEFRHCVRAHAEAYGPLMSSIGPYARRGRRGLPHFEFQALPAVTPRPLQQAASGASQKRKSITATPSTSARERQETRLRPVLDLAPPAAVLDRSGLDGFDRHLLEYLIHSFEVGRAILALQRKHGQVLKKWPANATISKSRAFADPLLALHIEKSARVWCPGDKFIIFRRQSPSMQLIQSCYPLTDPIRGKDDAFLRVFLWRLFLWRMYAFGKESRIKKVAGLRDLQDWNSMVARKKKKTAKGNVLCYSQFRITPASRQLQVFTRIWASIPELSRFLRSESLPSFDTVRDAIQALKIPFLPHNGLVTWLVTCDLFEYGLCQPPTTRDLALKIGRLSMEESTQTSGGSGPGAAFEVVARERGLEIPYQSQAALEEGLDRLHRAFLSVHGMTWREITGREFNMVDMEHALCKITREWKGQGQDKGS